MARRATDPAHVVMVGTTGWKPLAKDDYSVVIGGSFQVKDQKMDMAYGQVQPDDATEGQEFPVGSFYGFTPGEEPTLCYIWFRNTTAGQVGTVVFDGTVRRED